MKITVNSSRAEALMGRIADGLGPGGLNRIGIKACELLTRDSLESFGTSTDPETGGSWPPRKYTPQSRFGTSRGRVIRRRVKPWRLLVKTGALRRGTKARYVVQGGRVKIFGTVSGTAATYAEAHQFGTGTVPQRRYLGYRRGTAEELAAFAAGVIVGRERT